MAALVAHELLASASMTAPTTVAALGFSYTSIVVLRVARAHVAGAGRLLIGGRAKGQNYSLCVCGPRSSADK